MTCKECLDGLAAYVDGELPEDEAAVVRDHIASCEECAAAHRHFVESSMRLKGALVRYEAPDVLKARIRASLARGAVEVETARPRTFIYRNVGWPSLIAVAGIVAVMSSLVTLELSNKQPGVATIQNELLASHVRSLMPGHLTDVASNDQHNIKPWFNGRVDMSPIVPRLDSLGFPLVGGRIDYINGRSVPVIVYTRRQHVINVYAWPTNRPNVKAVTASSHGYNFIRVSLNGEELWIVSDLNQAELKSFEAFFAEKSG